MTTVSTVKAVFLHALAAMALCLCLASGAAAQEVPFQVKASLSSQRVSVGEPIAMEISVSGARNVKPPALDALEGFDVRFAGGRDVSSSYTTIINGRRSEQRFEGYILSYQLTPTRPGELHIPAIDVETERGRLHTTPMVVMVHEPQDDADIRLRLEVDDDQPYVGQPVTITLVWYLTKDPSWPHFTLPGLTHGWEIIGPVRQPSRSDSVVTIAGADVPLEQGRETVGATMYYTLTAQFIAIPQREGELRIGPATVATDLILRRGRGIFAQDETRRAVAASEEITLSVRPLPAQGRPAGFTGLVGRYHLSATATPTDVQVGDPITLQLRIIGPVAARATPPDLARIPEITSQFRIGDESSSRSASLKSREWSRTIRALSENVTEIPAIELPYFDAERGEYHMARSDPIPLRVRPTRVITAADALQQTGAPPVVDATPIEEFSGGIRHNITGPALLANQSFSLERALRSPLGVATVVVPPLAYAGVGVVLLGRRLRGGSESRRRRRRRAAGSALSALDAATAADGVADAIRGFVADCFDRQGASLTSAECVALIEPHHAAAAAELRSIMDACDQARYGSGAGGESVEALAQRARSLIRALDRSITGGVR